jgi:hypothetical protein
MFSHQKKVFSVALGAVLWLTPVAALAQFVQLQSDCPNNSCALYIGAEIPAGQQAPKPGPATGSTDFNPVGQPWTFTFQTGYPLTWDISDGGFWYTATFGQGGSIGITGPEGTFSGVITSGSTEGGELTFATGTVSVNFRGQWSDGQVARGSGYLNYADDSGPAFTSELIIIPVHGGNGRQLEIADGPRRL